jgi:hypothetical protein
VRATAANGIMQIGGVKYLVAEEALKAEELRGGVLYRPLGILEAGTWILMHPAGRCALRRPALLVERDLASNRRC